LFDTHREVLRNDQACALEKPAGFILLATGLVDPPIEGRPANCPSEVIRFCPICDGYEAIDRRMGVLGDIKAGGKKALFLRTYTKDVSLFLTDETADVEWREKLTKANVRIVGKLQQVRQGTENTVTVASQQGEIHEVDALYPALGCTVRSDLAIGLGNLEVNDHQRTTLGGLYAAGDVVTDLHQLSVAFGHAAIAATDIHNRLPPNPRYPDGQAARKEKMRANFALFGDIAILEDRPDRWSWVAEADRETREARPKYYWLNASAADPGSFGMNS